MPYYFVADKRIVNESAGKLHLPLVVDLGLEPIFRDCLAIPDQTLYYWGEGPGGSTGFILYPRRAGEETPPMAIYRPTDQHWFDCGRFWIGADADWEPCPDDFKRNSVSLGYDVVDNSGKTWVVPVVRSPDASRYSLPMINTFDFQGRYVSKRRDEDEHLWDMAGDVADALRSGNITEEQGARFVLTFLQVNYRIAATEFALMHHFKYAPLESTFNAMVLGAVTDWQMVREYRDVKKKETEEDEHDSAQD